MNINKNIIIKGIAERIKDLKRKREFHIGVTNIIKINACPRQTLFFSLAKFSDFSEKYDILPVVSKSNVIGTLSHFAFYLYYNLKDKSNPDFITSNLMAMALNKLKNERKIEYNYTIDRKDEIENEVAKYIKTFIKWASFSPQPSFCEKIIRFGILKGIIDRIDIINGKLLITDYKTSASAPRNEQLEQYKEQLGGYCYLIEKSDLKGYEFLPPRLVVIKKASWNTFIIEDFENYKEDFEALLKNAVKHIIGIIKGRIPPAINTQECYSCLNKNICAYFT